MRITYPDSGNLSESAHTLRIPPRGMRRQGQSKHTRTRPSPIGGRHAACGAWTLTPEPQAPPVWRAPEGPEGTGGLRGAAPNEVRMPSLAGGRARASTRTKPSPIGGRHAACGAWPGFEPTRRAKLAARTASGRAGHAAAGDLAGQQQRRKSGGPQQAVPRAAAAQ